MSEPAPRRVTPAGILVMSAREMASDRERWLQNRRYRPGVGYCIGSSDVPSILGIKDAGTPLHVWRDKVSDLRTPENEKMMWGRLHEDTIARYWRDRNHAAVHPVGLIANAAEPWNQTTLDRRVSSCPLGEGGEVRCALEIKTADHYAARSWHRSIPDRHLAQLIHQLFTTGFDHIHYALLKGGNDYHQGVVRAEAEREVTEYVMAQLRTFRAEHLPALGREVQPDWPIDDRAAGLIELDRIAHPERAETREIEALEDVMTFAQARAANSAAAKEYRRAKARLLQLADGARWVTLDSPAGPQLAYEFVPSDRSRVELSTLKERYPEAYDDPDIVQHSTSWKIALAGNLADTPED